MSVLAFPLAFPLAGCVGEGFCGFPCGLFGFLLAVLFHLLSHMPRVALNLMVEVFEPVGAMTALHARVMMSTTPESLEAAVLTLRLLDLMMLFLLLLRRRTLHALSLLRELCRFGCCLADC